MDHYTTSRLAQMEAGNDAIKVTTGDLAALSRVVIHQPIRCIMLPRSEVVVVPPTMPLSAVLATMNNHNRGYTFVEEGVLGVAKLTGIFTERNLLFNVNRLIESRLGDPASIKEIFEGPIGHFVSPGVESVAATWPVLYALRSMRSFGFRRLSVGDGQTLDGAVSERTVARYILSVYERCIDSEIPDETLSAHGARIPSLQDHHDADLRHLEAPSEDYDRPSEVSESDAIGMSRALLLQPVYKIMRRISVHAPYGSQEAVPHFAPDTSLQDVLSAMRRRQFGYAFITAPHPQGGMCPLGIFTERDYQRDVLPLVLASLHFKPSEVPDIYAAPIRNFMTPSVEGIEPEASVLSALRLMTSRYFRRLAILDNSGDGPPRILGAVSERTLVNYIDDTFRGAILCGPPRPQGFGWTTR